MTKKKKKKKHSEQQYKQIQNANRDEEQEICTSRFLVG